jgi:ion channel
MITKLFLAGCLMGLCVVIHASGVTWALSRIKRHPEFPGFWAGTWLFILVAAWIVVMHLFEIVVWAVFYFAKGAMPALQTAVYFSAVTYTTTGYGDLVLPPEFRLVGAIEALTGILMCGWSTAFFLTVGSRLYESPTAPAEQR